LKKTIEKIRISESNFIEVTSLNKSNSSITRMAKNLFFYTIPK